MKRTEQIIPLRKRKGALSALALGASLFGVPAGTPAIHAQETHRVAPQGREGVAPPGVEGKWPAFKGEMRARAAREIGKKYGQDVKYVFTHEYTKYLDGTGTTGTFEKWLVAQAHKSAASVNERMAALKKYTTISVAPAEILALYFSENGKQVMARAASYVGDYAEMESNPYYDAGLDTLIDDIEKQTDIRDDIRNLLPPRLVSSADKRENFTEIPNEKGEVHVTFMSLSLSDLFDAMASVIALRKVQVERALTREAHTTLERFVPIASERPMAQFFLAMLAHTGGPAHMKGWLRRQSRTFVMPRALSANNAAGLAARKTMAHEFVLASGVLEIHHQPGFNEYMIEKR